MRKKIQRVIEEPELILAVGLVWGHLNALQYEEAYKLGRGCLRVWPDDKRLLLMVAYAAVEVLEPLDKKMTEALEESQCKEWADLVIRRAAMQRASGKAE